MSDSLVLDGAAEARTVADLARLLRQLRRREARREGATELTYRELAAKTGWSRGAIGEYFRGHILPPTDRFDVLIRLLGATPAEQGVLATARDLVEERRRGSRKPAPPAAPAVETADGASEIVVALASNRAIGALARPVTAWLAERERRRRADLALELRTGDGRVIRLWAERVSEIESLVHGTSSAEAIAISVEPPAPQAEQDA